MIFCKNQIDPSVYTIYLPCTALIANRPQNLYLLTHDTEPSSIAGTALPMREIDFALKETLLADKIIVLADTCHSGGIGGKIGNRNPGERSELNRIYFETRSFSSSGSRCFLTHKRSLKATGVVLI